ncbi:Hypothetical protein NTJ_05942 [Nesidiocoris tenuis]|uniref:Uncharacterized protein n=1 Tax=Nesidiocoris tenuis TaxID=355587 RepID=A0ABN7ALM3_9HEMI|nr:Hypothetical protein NTJ_05942 [Nesidiocoris tenuis]
MVKPSEEGKVQTRGKRLTYLFERISLMPPSRVPSIGPADGIRRQRGFNSSKNGSHTVGVCSNTIGMGRTVRPTRTTDDLPLLPRR